MFSFFKKDKKKFLRVTPTNFGWGYGYGFFSNYRVCLQQLITNHRGKKLIPYIDWRNTTWVEGVDPMQSTSMPKNQVNPFDYWFEQQIPRNIDKVKFSKEKINPTIIDHSLNYFKDERLLEQQAVDKLYIKPKAFITDKIREIYKSEFEGEVVLGVMARGCEYNLHHPFYGVFGIDEYVEEVRTILDKRPDITKIFIVSEDSHYIERFKNEFSSVYYLKDVFRRTDETEEYMNKYHHWCNISKKRENHTKLLGEEVIVQTKLLGMSDYLIGRNSGIFCGAVLWSENIKEIFNLDLNAHSRELIETND